MASPILRNLFLALTAVGAVATVLGGCGGGGSSSTSVPQISAPPRGTTASPPALQLAPATITFVPGQPATEHILLSVPNPSFAIVAITHDSCTGKGIATAQASPEPNPTPTPGTVPLVYNVAAGAKDGKCTFTFEDMVSLAQASLAITNEIGGHLPSPTPTASTVGTPSPTPTPIQLQVSPTSMAFTGPNQSNIAAMSFGDQYQSYSENDNCGGIATASYFDYGDWNITSGSKAGSCAFNFTVTGFPSLGTAVMTVTNTAAARRRR